MPLRRLLAPALLALASMPALLPSARAAALDAPSLARFDVGYGRCEALYPYMRGHRDAAYLAVWRLRADATNLARLSKLRQGAPYRKEHQRFLRASTGPAAPAASSPIEQQCQALWAEKTKADARGAAAPAKAASRP
ncbi:MAG: hypothetical protein KF788_20850 [Piscinibacter sp.]|nr:hypothetical protein [Piscinibacter sp.]